MVKTMNNLIADYNSIMDKGIAITELYIYHLLVSDDRAYNFTETELLNMVEEVINIRYINYDVSIEEIVNHLLNGEQYNEENDLWDLY